MGEVMSRIREQVKHLWALILGLFGCAPLQEAPKVPQDPHKLLYGFYGAVPGQLEATKDFTNVVFVSPWGMDQTEQLQAIKAAGLKAVWMPADNSETGLTSQLVAWQSLALLDTLVALYWDEPDHNTVASPSMVRRVLASFPELSNVKLSASFSTAQDTPGIEGYDWVGVSAYAQGEGALVGEISALRAKLSSEQRLILFVYGADPWRLHPETFLDYAVSDSKVVALLAFVWFSHDGSDFGSGIGVNGMFPLYRAVGLRITH